MRSATPVDGFGERKRRERRTKTAQENVLRTSSLTFKSGDRKKDLNNLQLTS